MCHDELDKFGEIKKVICSFPKKPLKTIKPIQTPFFDISTKMYKNTFFLIINPVYKIKSYPIVFDLVKDKAVFDVKTEFSSKWMILGYIKEIPVIKKDKKNEFSINFPFYQDDELPYVGGLDIKGNPIELKDTDDVSLFIKIKKLYKQGKYDDCIDSADEILESYPNTIFKSELLYYKIKSYFKLRSYEDVIDLSKEFLKNFSSDNNIPEIVMMIAYGYYKNGMYSDADYFFDRLFNEHADSRYAKLGYIYKGDMLSAGGEDKKAKKFYKKALYSAKDVDIASLAAFKLAQINILNGKYKKAKEYIEKILKADKGFLYSHYTDTKDIMQSFVDNKMYKIAAEMALAVLDDMPKHHDDYEILLKNAGIWLAKTDEKKEALKILQRYIKEFNDGFFISDVEKTRDELFFATNKDTNTSDLLEKYNKLIEEYGDKPIGQKALYEKAKLMLKEKMYSDILQIKDDILNLDDDYKDKEEIVKDAAYGLMKDSLKAKQCDIVLDIQKDYNITVEEKFDDGLYECFYMANDFEKAKNIVLKHIDTKDIASKREWLYKLLKVDFMLHRYKDVIDESKDLISLIDNIQNSAYKDVYRYMFDSYGMLKDYDGMLDTITKIENIFGVDPKDIDRYVDMINLGVAKNDDNIIIKYAKKLYDLQNKINSYAQSPFVEFALYQAYMNKERYNEAYQVIKSLDKLKLKNNVRARQKYLLGEVLTKLWRDEEAKKAYKEAIKADPKSSWASLAKTALNL